MNNISVEDYNRIADMFRRPESCPNGRPNMSIVARLANCDSKTVKTAWTRGYPKRNLPPIKVLFEQEKSAARGELQMEISSRAARTRQAQEDIFQSAVQARKEEGALVSVARAATINNLRTAKALSDAARSMAPVLKDFISVEITALARWVEFQQSVLDCDLSAASAKEDVRDVMQRAPVLARPAMTLSAAMQLLTQLSGLTKQIVDTGKVTMDLERMFLGSPDAKAEENAPTREMTHQEATAVLAAAVNATTHLARTSGKLTVIPGGKISDEESVGEEFTG